MKIIYSLLLSLSLFLLNISASFAGGIPCETNSPPQINLSSACGSILPVHVGVAVNITGMIQDNDPGDLVNLNSPVLPIGATTTPTLPTSGTVIPFTFHWIPAAADAGTTILVTFTATDLCGATAVCTFTMQVTCAPIVVNCPADTSVLPTTSQCSAVVSFVASASTPSGLANFIATPSPGSTFPAGTTTVVAMATDVCGNTATCGFSVTVAAASPPTITCPADIVTPATTGTPACGASVNFVVSAFSLAGIADFDVTPSPGSFFPVGKTTVVASATDGCGTVSTCSFDVTVTAPSPPTITCPADIVTPATSGSPCGASVSFVISAYSSVGIDDFDVTPSPGSFFPVGKTTVVATATDGCGNVSTCSFDVIVTNNLTVDAGPDVSTVFGYPATQTATNTAVASSGSGSYSYAWTLSRALRCNQVNSSGDELFTGGACNNNICPGTGSATAAAPSCTGSATISATLLADAIACVTVTDVNSGCTASDCFNIFAADGRCFTGNSGKKKVKICHRTGNPVNPWIQICLDKPAVSAHLAHHSDDYVGPCTSNSSRSMSMDDEDGFTLYPNPVGSELTLEFEAEAKRTIQLYNSIGELLFESAVSDAQMKLDMTGIPKGIYLISVRDEDNHVELKKLVKM